jgi:hypothetical protein
MVAGRNAGILVKLGAGPPASKSSTEKYFERRPATKQPAEPPPTTQENQLVTSLLND